MPEVDSYRTEGYWRCLRDSESLSGSIRHCNFGVPSQHEIATGPKCQKLQALNAGRMLAECWQNGPESTTVRTTWHEFPHVSLLSLTKLTLVLLIRSVRSKRTAWMARKMSCQALKQIQQMNTNIYKWWFDRNSVICEASIATQHNLSRFIVVSSCLVLHHALNCHVAWIWHLVSDAQQQDLSNYHLS